MADINALSAFRAIVDKEGKPLPEFLLLWQRMVEQLTSSGDARLYDYAEFQQQINVGAIYEGGLAQTTADAALEALGSPQRSGLDINIIATSGGSWVSAGSETLNTVSAGNLAITNSGPLQATGANGVTDGEWRIIEDPSGAATVMFTGTWRAHGDGITYSLVQNLSVEPALAFSLARPTTGSVEYGIEVRVTSGLDVSLLVYMFVRRS